MLIEAGSKQEVRAGEAWHSFTTVITFLKHVLSAATQIALIVNVSRSTGGPFFAFLCLVKPIFDFVSSRNVEHMGTLSTTHPAFFDPEGSLYHMFAVCFAYVDNEDVRRMSALRTFTDAVYRQDLISNNLGEWIIYG